ncbi:hypothetical protein BYT27DRAFT_7205995 [Phlegmacium glaucopus]|nr:hypothetical protein BYT27DRAFT_7205995 [Phlegmacium glaucopus]
MASFWLNIATVRHLYVFVFYLSSKIALLRFVACLRLFNFNSTSCIFGGVTQSSVTRIRETMLMHLLIYY